MLISVKNPTEAIIAAKHPLVSIVDLKDPDSGPLGFAGADAVAEVALQPLRVAIAMHPKNQSHLVSPAAS